MFEESAGYLLKVTLTFQEMAASAELTWGPSGALADSRVFLVSKVQCKADEPEGRTECTLCTKCDCILVGCGVQAESKLYKITFVGKTTYK